VKLMELLAALPEAQVGRAAGTNPDILRIEHDSRRVVPGDLFVAIRGEKFDGWTHAPEAARQGAAAIVSDRQPPAGLSDVPWVMFPRPRLALARLAARLAGNPAESLVLAGVTGTNGKTTTTTLIAELFEKHFGASGFLGTVGYRAGGRSLEASRTTPEAPVIQELLADMVRQRIPAAAMEVSSHALVLERVEGCRFDAAVFTNLTPEHLDFHGDMETYYAAKKMLFDLRKPGAPAVVNADDASGARLASELAGPVVTYSARGLPATAVAANVSCDLSGTVLDAVGPDGRVRIESPMIGRFNVENLLAAAACGFALKIPAETIRHAFASVRNVPGRFERVTAGQPYTILVDYAHTADALERLLLAVREISDHRIILVFGCGGDRDRSKRAPMGAIAGKLADIAIATSDNPRSEDPETILSEIERGLEASGANYRKIADRAEAIQAAIALAREDDESIVVIAGKGHETTQVIGNREIPFDDRRVAAEAARR
jgi:UDP-N-acetylmuramoyl-L-alanyl-D-glutamate--2,6-diaminopimelate ligase